MSAAQFMYLYNTEYRQTETFISYCIVNNIAVCNSILTIKEAHERSIAIVKDYSEKKLTVLSKWHFNTVL